MEVIEITIQIEPGTEEIHIAAESKELGPEMVIYMHSKNRHEKQSRESSIKLMSRLMVSRPLRSLSVRVRA